MTTIWPLGHSESTLCIGPTILARPMRSVQGFHQDRLIDQAFLPDSALVIAEMEGRENAA
jgi:hypothetical protein